MATPDRRSVIRSGLATVSLCALATLALPSPAHANFVRTIRNILSGDTGSAASGRSRGGGIRDEACQSRGMAANPELSEQLVALVPETPTRTSQATPSVFLNVPFDRNTSNMVLVFELAAKEAANSRVVAGPLTVPLPEQPGLMQYQFPADAALAVGETYEWTFRLICQGNPSSEDGISTALSPLPTSPLDIENIGPLAFGRTADSAEVAYPDLTVRQEVFGEVERVQAGADVTLALQTQAPYQAYADANLWLDTVEALAVTRTADWTTLLAEFGLGEGVPNPQMIEGDR